MTNRERIAAARAFVTEWVQKALADAKSAEQVADLDRAAAHARIDRAIELGVEDPVWTGWSWQQGRDDADNALRRAREHRETVELAAALVSAGMDAAVRPLFAPLDDALLPEGTDP